MGLRAIRRVWLIDLENQEYAQSFGTPAADPYLARALPRMGTLLENYYAIGHSSATNYIAQVSGRAPNLATQSDCPLWTPFPGQRVAVVLADGRIPGMVTVSELNPELRRRRLTTVGQ